MFVNIMRVLVTILVSFHCILSVDGISTTHINVCKNGENFPPANISCSNNVIIHLERIQYFSNQGSNCNTQTCGQPLTNSSTGLTSSCTGQSSCIQVIPNYNDCTGSTVTYRCIARDNVRDMCENIIQLKQSEMMFLSSPGYPATSGFTGESCECFIRGTSITSITILDLILKTSNEGVRSNLFIQYGNVTYNQASRDNSQLVYNHRLQLATTTTADIIFTHKQINEQKLWIEIQGTALTSFCNNVTVTPTTPIISSSSPSRSDARTHLSSTSTTGHPAIASSASTDEVTLSASASTQTSGISSGLTSTQTPEISSGLTSTQTPGISTGLTSSQTPEISSGLTTSQTPEISTGLPTSQTPEISSGITSSQTPEISSGITSTATPEISSGITSTPTPEISSGITSTLTPEISSDITSTPTPEISSDAASTPTHIYVIVGFAVGGLVLISIFVTICVVCRIQRDKANVQQQNLDVREASNNTTPHYFVLDVPTLNTQDAGDKKGDISTDSSPMATRHIPEYAVVNKNGKRFNVAGANPPKQVTKKKDTDLSDMEILENDLYVPFESSTNPGLHGSSSSNVIPTDRASGEMEIMENDLYVPFEDSAINASRPLKKEMK